MRCLVCQKNEISFDPIFGAVPCSSCRRLQGQYSLPLTNPPEFAGESIRGQRKAFNRDILQKHRYGEVSKEWVDAYPNKATKEEKAKAKYVWRND